MNKEVDLTNKVVLDLDKYMELVTENKLLKQKEVNRDDKYNSLLKYLFSECEIQKSGERKYLAYDSYNNHLANYLKQIEPEMYAEQLERNEEED